MVEISKKSYDNGRIYCIRNSISDDLYIGSTTQSLSKRMQKHRSSMTSERDGNMLIYQKMREIGKEHFYIELYENYPCENIEQLRKREGEVIRELQPTLNKRVENRTLQEWKEQNKDKIKEQIKKWHEEHKEELKEYNKKYREENKEVITERKKEHYENNKEHYKVYREEHKNRINNNNKIYYQENRHKELERARLYRENNEAKFKETIKCTCGSTVRKKDIRKHERSKKHQNYEQSLKKE